MKKIILLVLALTLIFALASCKKKQEPVVENPAPEENIPEVEVIKYSEGLEFTSGDETCMVKGIGSCVDTDIIVPKFSPEGLKVVGIDSSAFAKSDSVVSITLHEDITKIGDYAFKNCKSLTKVIFAEDSQLKEIGKEAFLKCSNLAFITLPDELMSIGESAFSNCHALTVINVSPGVTSIGSKAFSNCLSLKKISVDESNSDFREINGVLYSSDGKVLLQYPTGKTDKYFEIPDDVTTIGSYAFAYCDVIKGIVISDDVTTISGHAFEGCDALVSVDIPNSVTYMGEYAFYSCTGLLSIELPYNMNHIGNLAFNLCYSLTEIKVGYGNTTFKDMDGVLYSYDGKTLIQYPAGKKDKTFEIPSSVTTIGMYAFRRCESIQTITLSSGSRLSIIDIGAFFECKALTSIELPSTLTKINANAFSSTALKNVYYAGGESQWTKIGVSKSDINNATVHYNSTI